LIWNSPLAGFSSAEIDVLANVVRYHRKALPKLRHEGFAALPPADRHRVKVLGGLLRLASGLDRSHSSVVTRLTCEHSRGRLEIYVQARGECELELWTANRRSELLEEALGLPVVVYRAEVPDAGEGAAPSDAADAGTLDVEGLAIEPEGV
jgi:exopolyphosphatase/guanosine-5'-triphosphate,3'-diphosphate pyrophosphatase